jgi:hypothetical protein
LVPREKLVKFAAVISQKAEQVVDQEWAGYGFKILKAIVIEGTKEYHWQTRKR